MSNLAVDYELEVDLLFNPFWGYRFILEPKNLKLMEIIYELQIEVRSKAKFDYLFNEDQVLK